MVITLYLILLIAILVVISVARAAIWGLDTKYALTYKKRDWGIYLSSLAGGTYTYNPEVDHPHN